MCLIQKVTTWLLEPVKLTTWQENAYKPLQIPPPSKILIGATAADGDSSLVLAQAPIATSSVIDWRDPEIGRVLLPVCLLSTRISVALQQRRRHGVATTTTESQCNGRSRALSAFLTREI